MKKKKSWLLAWIHSEAVKAAMEVVPLSAHVENIF
jgi:hypothetical protein